MKKVTALLVAATLGVAIQVSTASAFNPQPDPPKSRASKAQSVNPALSSKATRKMGVTPEPFRKQSSKPGSQGGEKGIVVVGTKPGGDAAAKGLLPAVQKQPGVKQR
jgi:hypothetical protein